MISKNEQRSSRSRSGDKPLYTLMSDVKPKLTEWLWQARIPLGELTLVDGDPGTSKSTFTLDLAARVSTGAVMPDGTKGVAGGVILLTAEDSLRKTLPYRLAAAGADMTRIAVMPPLTIPADLGMLEEAVFRIGARLLVIDPLMFYLAGDANREQGVRQALIPLRTFAERANLAVLMVRHLNKSGGKQSLYRGGGSIGIIATVRSGFLVATDPEDTDMRVLCQHKSNLGPLAPSILFEPVQRDGSVAIEWHGDCDYTADQLLGGRKGHDGKLEEAKAFLAEVLSDGPMAEKEIEIVAKALGSSHRTMERAKLLLGIVSERRGFGPGSHIVWSLPEGDQKPHRPTTETWRPMEAPVSEVVPAPDNYEDAENIAQSLTAIRKVLPHAATPGAFWREDIELPSQHEGDQI